MHVDQGYYWLSCGGVPEKEYENCLEWAFGKFEPNTSVRVLRETWNRKHGDIFFLSEHDKLSISIVAIGKAYMETNFEGGIKSNFSQAQRVRNIFSIPGMSSGLGKGGF